MVESRFGIVPKIPEIKMGIDPRSAIESVDTFLHRVKTLDCTIPVSAQKNIEKIKEAAAGMANHIQTDEAFNTFYSQFIHSVSNLVNDNEFWNSLPEIIPYGDETVNALKNDIKLLSNPDNWKDATLTEPERQGNIASINAKLQGESKTTIRNSLRSSIEVFFSDILPDDATVN